jgi:hypothetical protein
MSQRALLQSKKAKPVTSISDADRQKLAGTFTGEIFQPMRLHYDVSDPEDFAARLFRLDCIDYDSQRKRWVWLYFGEARTLDFAHGIDEDTPVILGEFIAKGDNKTVLNVRSFERGQQAVEFFDRYISRKTAKLTHVTICNKLFRIDEVSSIASLDHYFEQTETLVRHPERITQELLDLTFGIDNQQERSEIISQFLKKLNNEPIPELEKFPVHFYEEGIDQLKMQLNISKNVAYQHWQGNINYTTMDVIHDAVLGNRK